jgi:rhomboid protease GluP
MSEPAEQPPPPGSRPAHAPVPTPPSTGVPIALTEFGRSVRALTPRGFVTEAIIAANVIVFALMVIRGVSPTSPTIENLLAWGANYAPRTAGGQWWRLFTATFLHIGFFHLAMNMYVLWSVGPLVERMLGNVGFLLMYVVAGLCGSVASVAWSPNTVSAGASGAVFGVYGCLMGFLVMQRRSVPRDVLASLQRNAVLFLGYNLVFGFAIKGIDMAAHLGGLAGGFAGGLVLAHPLDAAGASRRWTRNVTLALGAAILILAATRLTPHHTDVGPDLEAFAAMEGRTLKELRRVVQENEDGRLTSAATADVIEKEILPAWQALHQKLAAAEGLPPPQRELVQSIVEYMRVREEAFALLGEGARTGDQGLVQKAMAKYGQADELVRAMNEKAEKKSEKK